MMTLIPNIPSCIEGFDFVNSGNNSKAIVKNNITFFSKIIEMKIYEEKLDGKQNAFWIIAKTFREVAIFRIYKPEIIMLLSVKGLVFKDNTQVQFMYKDRYYFWDVNNLEYIGMKNNLEFWKFKEDEKINCCASSKISEFKVGENTEKDNPPN